MSKPGEPFSGAAFLNFLRERDLMDEVSLQRVAIAASETGTSVERAILQLGLVGEDTLYRAISDFIGCPFLNLEDIDLSQLQSGLLTVDYMQRMSIVPANEKDAMLIFATSQVDIEDLTSTLSYALNRPIALAISTPSTIKTVLEMTVAGQQAAEIDASSSDIARLEALANNGPVITLVNDLISKAVAIGASDVHVEATERGSRVRYRVDGALNTDRTIPDGLKDAVASRLKIMAKLNISEKRRPQDGRASLMVRGRNIDIRMSSIPTQYGESIVLRILDRDRVHLDWTKLGFAEDRVATIRRITAQPNGIFLVAGPTGSGKTTTLYTALNDINLDDRKVVTVEDPIEYTLPGINQVQVDPEIDMSFAAALRAILRQDPNVVMIGEIRDEETAAIAVRAALIGRLVLSTIHTNDALGAIDRLLDLGVAPYLVGATLRGVLSQRLVRTICRTCDGHGCSVCRETGYSGRTVMSELLQVTPAVSEAITEGVRGKALGERLRFGTIEEDAERLIKSGAVAIDDAHGAILSDTKLCS